ncbi:hypothetical protein BWI96_18840 [Siphonobacter sp. SORGH_AS_0500]|uniref:hypothetical protein n=1 Tax=Siphonobacter sp. SORGH_AS_0500 TaxID=1864824 RepID=UPI000CB963AC|nr:hypothetical protein [Siphonobacter sp. SORGH_AS_0500]PKK35111.1 hypothetical protein BWI96_18840 [Siphonobacter sp. SORGH_AS_0500]
MGFQQVSPRQGLDVVKNREGRYFSYGLVASYQPTKNGIEIDMINYPYRIAMLFKNSFSDYINPNNLTLLSVLYRRELINQANKKFKIYALAGAGVGNYRYLNVQQGTSYIKDGNGNILFSSNLKTESDYRSTLTLFPQVRLELEKKIFASLYLSLYGQYTVRNILSSVPLEKGSYSFYNQGQSGSGTIANYGSGYQIGLQVKYGFKWLDKLK